MAASKYLFPALPLYFLLLYPFTTILIPLGMKFLGEAVYMAMKREL
jgi:hypothetical protein